MARAFWLAVLLLAPFIDSVAAAAPLEVYGQLPSLEDVRISPDGHSLARVATENEQRSVIVQSLDPGGTSIRMAAGSLKLRDITWAGPQHLIITASTTGNLGPSVISKRNEWFRAVDFNWSKRTLRPIAWRPPLDVIDGPPVIRFLEGRPVAFVEGLTFVHDHGRPALLKVDLDAGVTTVEALGFPNTEGFAVGANGEAIAQTEFDAGKNRWSLDLWAHGQWQEVEYANSTIESPELLGLGRDGSSIAVEFGSNTGDVIRELRTDGQTWGDPYPVESSEELIWDSATYKLIAEGGVRGDQRIYHFFDPGDQQAWDGAVSAFPTSQVRLVSMTDDHRKFVIRADRPAEGPAYFLVDAATKKATLIGAEYAGLQPADIAVVRPVAFKAADGLALTGYLTLPPGKPAAKLPLVVLAHGGPAARDEPGFDWWSQAMASRGYAVLQINFRGSQGLGWALESAGFGEWGRKMQTDLSDGVKFLVSQGVVDPQRVCIVGASYGGYAALAGATLDASLYRCAASVAGISDLNRFIAYSKGRQGALAQRFWMRFIGDKVSVDDLSPARLAPKVTVPILLVHGKDDVVVPYQQSQIMADALAKAGKPFEFVTLKNEDHWLSRGATRLQMLEALVAFLQKNDPA